MSPRLSSGNSIQFEVGETRLICISDESANRMRIIAQVAVAQQTFGTAYSSGVLVFPGFQEKEIAMPWWGWLIVGALLFTTELMVVDLQFYLIFIGLAAIIVGLLDLGDMPWQPWAEWVCFCGITLISVYYFRRHVYQKGRG